mgnify:CR=1 FL=1
MPDLNSLGLTEDAAPQVDWDAPEAGKTPPCVFPGLYTLRFKLGDDPDNWFDAVEREVIKGNPESKRKFLELTYEPEVIANSQGMPIAAEDGSTLRLPPQRANTFLSPKMRINQLSELLRAMGVRVEGNLLSQIGGIVKELDGKATFQAEIIWRAYFKSTDTTVSTHPRSKKSGELLWTRNAEGLPDMLAKNPQTGETSYGYPEIARVKLPTFGDGQ